MIRLYPCARLPRPPLGLGAIVAGWSFAVILFTVLSNSIGGETGLCHIRGLTGVPCATCGGSRAAFSLLRGDIAGALQFNPLVTFALLAGGLVLAIRMLKGRQAFLRLGRRGWLLATAILIAAVAANWVYVIGYHTAE